MGGLACQVALVLQLRLAFLRRTCATQRRRQAAAVQLANSLPQVRNTPLLNGSVAQTRLGCPHGLGSPYAAAS